MRAPIKKCPPRYGCHRVFITPPLPRYLITDLLHVLYIIIFVYHPKEYISPLWLPAYALMQT